MRVADAPDSEAATLVKDVALRLIALAGFDGCGGVIRAAGGEGLYEIAVESSSDAATRYLLDVAVRIAENLMSSDSITSERLAVSEYVEEAVKIALKSDLGPSTRAIVAAAEARAIPWSREANNSSSIQFGYGRNLRRIRAEVTAGRQVIADTEAGNKDTLDITEPMPAVRAGIIEINSVPGLRMRAYPSAGPPRDVGRSIVEMLYPEGAESRIPIVAVTGTNGKTTVTRLTSHILTGTGKNVGTATTDGILLNGESLVSGDMTGPASARSILDDNRIDIAVLETARGGILRRGLGWDWADIAVVTNITEDHIGQDGIESVKDLVEIKSLVAERVRENGTLILNADDPESAALPHRPLVARTKKEIVYFALSAENPILKRHMEHEGTGYFTADNQIVEARDGLNLNIAEIQSIPITMSGSAAFQIQNALASTAVGRALGLSAEKITEGLYSFDGNRNNPGRCNIYKVRDGHVLIDYGHNPKAVDAICSMTARWMGKTVTGIISFPGDRSDDLIESAGRIAAAGFDLIIVKGDVNLRGRKSGEVAEMLCRLVREADRQRECRIVLDAASAFDEAISEIKKDEVIVFFYEKLPPALATLAKYGAEPVSSIC